MSYNGLNEWHYPKVEDGKPTKYNWAVQNLESFDLGVKTDIGDFSYINALNCIVIKDDIQIGSYYHIYSISIIDDTFGEVVLKRNCKIGSHSTVLPCVIVGKNSMIGAHSLINIDIPDNMVAFGLTAKVIRVLLGVVFRKSDSNHAVYLRVA